MSTEAGGTWDDPFDIVIRTGALGQGRGGLEPNSRPLPETAIVGSYRSEGGTCATCQSSCHGTCNSCVSCQGTCEGGTCHSSCDGTCPTCTDCIYGEADNPAAGLPRLRPGSDVMERATRILAELDRTLARSRRGG